MPRVDVTVWHMELGVHAEFQPSVRQRSYALAQVTAPSPEFFRFLYVSVGSGYHWTDRLPWSLDEWAARLADPSVEVWVAWADGAPLGYLELQRRTDGVVEICYFGLLPHAVGAGQGGVLLSDAVERAWALGATRVYLNSCSLDHPAAMANYRARGFRVVREEVKPREIA